MLHLSGILLTSILIFTLVFAIPLEDHSQAILSAPSTKPHNSSRPLVIWHGLGDTAYSAGIIGFIADVKGIYPGIFVHSVKIPEKGTMDDERRAGFVCSLA